MDGREHTNFVPLFLPWLSAGAGHEFFDPDRWLRLVRLSASSSSCAASSAAYFFLFFLRHRLCAAVSNLLSCGSPVLLVLPFLLQPNRLMRQQSTTHSAPGSPVDPSDSGHWKPRAFFFFFKHFVLTTGQSCRNTQLKFSNEKTAPQTARRIFFSPPSAPPALRGWKKKSL